MKKLELKQLEVINGGMSQPCHDEMAGIWVGWVVAGALVGGPGGAVVGLFGGMIHSTVHGSANC